jgi:adenylate cyclase
MLKKILLSPWTALITLAIILSIRIANPVFVESFRLLYFDTLIANKAPTENNIITVNVDEDSLNKYGQWPLPRNVYADLVENLYKRGAGLVVLNVFMTETDRMGGDGALAATMNEFPVVLPSQPSDKNKNKPRKPSTAVIGSEFLNEIDVYGGIISNVSLLESRAAGVGIVNTMKEVDGKVRRIPLVIAANDTVYPSLAMEALRLAAGDSTTQIKLNELGVDKMRIPQFGPITTDSKGRVWIDWSQRSKSISMIDQVNH